MTKRPAIRAQQRIWKALRVQKVFEAPLVAAAAQVAETTVKEYLGLLKRAGYVEVVRNANSRTGQVNRWRLLRDTGPKAPRRLFDNLQDDNINALTPLAPAQRNGRPNLGGGGDGRIREIARVNMLRAGAR